MMNSQQLYKVVVKSVYRNRHIIYFTDKKATNKCLDVMRTYYNKHYGYFHTLWFDTLWTCTYDGKAYCHDGCAVSNFDKLFKLAIKASSDILLFSDNEIITIMFGEKIKFGFFESKTKTPKYLYTFTDHHYIPDVDEIELQMQAQKRAQAPVQAKDQAPVQAKAQAPVQAQVKQAQVQAPAQVFLPQPQPVIFRCTNTVRNFVYKDGIYIEQVIT